MHVHATWFVLVAVFSGMAWYDGGGEDALWTVAYLIALFTCILLHEFGHIEAARAFGTKTLYVVLLPIGGMARFASLPRRPVAEILIALAGPAVNAAIALGLASTYTLDLEALTDDSSPGHEFGSLLLVANVAMGLFNLLPIFPMDGGRVLRGLLAMRLPYVRATFWAAALGKVLAASGAVYFSLWEFSPLTLILLAFVIWAGETEYRWVKRQEPPIAQAM